MELSRFTIGIIFIFFPGILALVISERLTTHPERKGYELLAYALLLGCVAHLLYELAYSLAVRWIALPDDRWLELLTSEDVSIQGPVVFYTAFVGALLGFLVALAVNRSWLHRVARLLKVTRKFADPDVWAYLMNSDQISWVVVRNQEHNLMYQGNVVSFSTDEDPRELVLNNVTVFQNDTAAKLYDVELMYLSFDKKSVTLEVYRS